jgi:nucleotide-binding universal stress UspA family protein
VFRSVLLTTDGSPLSRAAVPHALRLVDRRAGVIRVVHVAQSPPDLPGQAVPLASGEGGRAPLTTAANAAMHAAGHAHVDAIRSALKAAGASHVDVAVLDGEPGTAIVADARASHAEVVVMATHGRSGLARTLVGSVADHVLRELGDIPLALVRPTRDDEAAFKRDDWAARGVERIHSGPGGFQHVLVPIDGSELAMAVLPHVTRAIDPATTAVDLLMVIGALPVDASAPPTAAGGRRPPEEPESFGDREGRAWIERGRTRLDVARERIEAAGARRVDALIRDGIPEQVIVEYAVRRGADLVAMATHGRSGITRTLLGSVPDYVVRHLAGTPILLIRPPTNR